MATLPPPLVRLVNRFYGRPNIPIGVALPSRKDPPKRRYTEATLDAWGEPAVNGFPSGVSLIEGLLWQSPAPLVIVQVGFSSNLAALVATEAGRGLVRGKVRLLSVMAGDFTGGKPEYNVREDLPAPATPSSTPASPTCSSPMTAQPGTSPACSMPHAPNTATSTFPGRARCAWTPRAAPPSSPRPPAGIATSSCVPISMRELEALMLLASEPHRVLP